MRPDFPMGNPMDNASQGLGAQVVAGAGLTFAALAASQLSAGLLVVVVALAAAVGASALARDFEAAGLNAPPLLYAAGAVLLPVAVFRFREPGLAAAAAALPLGPIPTMSGAVAGLGGALIGVAALLSLMDLPVRPRLVIEIGLAVGSALTLGMLAWALLRPDQENRQADEDRSPFHGGVLNALQAGLLSAPALFYALRLALR